MPPNSGNVFRKRLGARQRKVVWRALGPPGYDLRRNFWMKLDANRLAKPESLIFKDVAACQQLGAPGQRKSLPVPLVHIQRTIKYRTAVGRRPDGGEADFIAARGV